MNIIIACYLIWKGTVPIQITGFGGFEVKDRAARTGRNPKTGEAVEIPASKYVAFSAGSALKEKVNAEVEAELKKEAEKEAKKAEKEAKKAAKKAK